ncbi:MAG: DUF2271 domain-containing protein [Pseudomonadota bacterium]|jgi:hypothetical protein|tara:strand:+ start:436 stop:972 length:537 start_codon:yes stop_codon:yes gene_type:complete
MPRSRSRHFKAVIASLLLASSMPALAAPREFVVEIELPRIPVAEYHRPYVAGWIEDAQGRAVVPLLVWYDVKKREDGGKRWLPEMRTWWRRAGRAMTLPANGVTGATRAPGRNVIALPANGSPLSRLPAGHYSFAVEAAREAGGREVVRAPFNWRPGGSVNASAVGTGELRTIRIVSR